MHYTLRRYDTQSTEELFSSSPSGEGGEKQDEEAVRADRRRGAFRYLLLGLLRYRFVQWVESLEREQLVESSDDDDGPPSFSDEDDVVEGGDDAQGDDEVVGFPRARDTPTNQMAPPLKRPRVEGVLNNVAMRQSRLDMGWWSLHQSLYGRSATICVFVEDGHLTEDGHGYDASR